MPVGEPLLRIKGSHPATAPTQESNMKRQPIRLFIHLGSATKRTLGAAGNYTDFVRMLDHWGISRD